MRYQNYWQYTFLNHMLQVGSSASLNDALDVKVGHLVLLVLGILLNL